MQKEVGINPSLYFLISLLFFLNFYAVHVNLLTISFPGLLDVYLRKISSHTLADRMLYVFPMGGLLYLLIKTVSKIFGRNKDQQQAFLKFCFYWVGSSCLTYLFTEAFVNLLVFYFAKTHFFFSEKYKGIIIAAQVWFYACWQLLSFVLPLNAVVKNTVTDLRTRVLFWTIPVITFFSVPAINYLTIVTIDLFGLDKPQTVAIESTFGSDSFAIRADTLDIDSSFLLVEFNGILKNNTESSYYIDTSSFISVVDTSGFKLKTKIILRKNDFAFKIFTVNGNKLLGGTILKPGDISAISLQATVEKSIFDKFLPPGTNKKFRKGDWKLLYGLLNLSDQKGTTLSMTENIEVVFFSNDIFK